MPKVPGFPITAEPSPPTPQNSEEADPLYAYEDVVYQGPPGPMVQSFESLSKNLIYNFPQLRRAGAKVGAHFTQARTSSTEQRKERNVGPCLLHI